MYLEEVCKNQSKLRGFLYSLHGYKDEVDDILQDTNITLINKAEQFDTNKDFLPWALGIARWTWMAHKKRRAKHLNKLTYDSNLMDILLNIKDDNLRDDLIYDAEIERLKLIELIRERLNPKYLFIFDSTLEGKSLSQIGEEMGWTSRAVSTAKYRIVQKGKKIISTLKSRDRSLR